jgi:hypothetical protein
MLNLEKLFGGSLDMLGDLMSMSGTKQQGTQDQHVQSALQKFNPVRSFFRHRCWKIFYPEF